MGKRMEKISVRYFYNAVCFAHLLFFRFQLDISITKSMKNKFRSTELRSLQNCLSVVATKNPFKLCQQKNKRVTHISYTLYTETADQRNSSQLILS